MAFTRVYVLFFFNDTATTEIYTLSLHDALPICPGYEPPPKLRQRPAKGWACRPLASPYLEAPPPGQGSRSCRSRSDRKSTRLNSSHANISYAVFCLKKKKQFSYKHVSMSEDTFG